MMQSAIAIIQARMGSSRLPGKSLAEIIPGLPLIEMVIRRAMKSTMSSLTVLATSRGPDCDPLADIAARLDCQLVRGDESDVLSRFRQAVELYRPQAVVRVCADNPFIAPEEIDRLVEFFSSNDFDYAANNRLDADDHGSNAFGAEIFRADLLEELPEHELTNSDREHVTAFFQRHPERYQLADLPPAGVEHGKWPKLDIDFPEDLTRVRKIAAALPSASAPFWTLEQIISHSIRIPSSN